MGTLITWCPGGTGPGAIAKVVWGISQGLLEAAALGHREVAGNLGMALINMRVGERRCTPAMDRVIDHALAAANRRLSPEPAAETPAAPVIPLRPWRFEPIQPDDGEVA